MVSRNRRPLLIVLAAVSSLLLAAAPVASQAVDDGPEAAPNELLVGFEPGVSAGDRAQARRSNDARLIEVVVADDTGRGAVERVAIPNGSDRTRYERRFESDPNVAYAEPNWKVDIVETSDDPYYTNGSLWGMYGDGTSPANAYGSQAGEAWTAGNIGSSDVWVGVIDQGIQHAHPDLDANVGPNPLDPTFDGIDDDGNGKVDDVYGWDFYNNDNSVYDSKKHDEHGTHVAGTIGAKGGNGAGVAGVNWNVKMLSGKFLGPRGGYTSDAVKAVNYFSQFRERYNAGDPRGLNVVATNNSWGGGGHSDALSDAIERARLAGVLFVAAAGNDGTNNDTTVRYPSGYPQDNIIAVAALRSDGSLASWSNYGATTVDLAAPGAGIYSTVPDGSYASFSGTSMAAPHVAGAAALYKAADPAATYEQVRDAIFATTTDTSSVDGKVLTSGRLDVSSFLVSVIGNPPEATTTSASTEEDTAVAINLGGTDAETCELTFAIVSGPSDGALSGLTSPSDNCTGSSGSYADSASVTYTPAADHNGSASFTYSVTDGDGNSDSSTVTVTIDPLNDAPLANDDAVDAVVGMQASFNVLANDTDVDGDDLDIASHDTVAGLSCDLETGDCTYTAESQDTIQFSYTATDGALTDIATVTISVSDQAATIHVGDLDGSSLQGPGPNQDVTVAVEVHDAGEAVVEGATVSGAWHDGTSVSCTTGAGGTCEVTGRFNSKHGTVATFTVNLVSASGYSYDSFSNHDEDDEDESNGTAITIAW